MRREICPRRHPPKSRRGLLHMSEAKRFCRTYRWRQDDHHVAISCTGDDAGAHDGHGLAEATRHVVPTSTRQWERTSRRPRVPRQSSLTAAGEASHAHDSPPRTHYWRPGASQSERSWSGSRQLPRLMISPGPTSPVACRVACRTGVPPSPPSRSCAEPNLSRVSNLLVQPPWPIALLVKVQMPL